MKCLMRQAIRACSKCLLKFKAKLTPLTFLEELRMYRRLWSKLSSYENTLENLLWSRCNVE